MEDYVRSGRPKGATIDEIVELVHSLSMCARRRGLRNKATQIGIRFGVVQSILAHIFGMSKVSAKWIPRVLTKDQMKSRLDISKYLQSL